MRILFDALSLDSRSSGTRSRLFGLLPELVGRNNLQLAVLHGPRLLEEERARIPGVRWLPVDRPPRGAALRAIRQGAAYRDISREYDCDLVVADCVPFPSGVPLIPVGVVGAEEAHPVLFKAYAPARALGLPFLPVTPTFPLLGPLGAIPLPSKWVIRFGEPLHLDHLPDAMHDDELLVSRLNAELREKIQALVEVGLSDRASVFA